MKLQINMTIHIPNAGSQNNSSCQNIMVVVSGQVYGVTLRR